MRLFGWPLALALVLSLSPLALAATAELPDLPKEILDAPSTLTTAQQKQLDNFIRACMADLTNEDEDLVSKGRDKLIDVFASNGSSVFNSAFISTLSPQLKRALSSTSIPVKVNVLIVASRQIDASTVDLAVMAMKDDCPAVRYWAAKVMVELASTEDTSAPRYTLTAADQTRMLATAADRLAEKEPPQVVAQLIDVLANLSNLGTPGAIDRAIDALNTRLDLDGSLSDASALFVDAKGLSDVYTTLVVQANRPNVKIADATYRQLALAGFRYMVLALNKLNQGDVHLSEQAQYQKMVELGETVVMWVSSQLGASSPSSDFKALLNSRDWPGLILRADQWRQLLKDKPFNFQDKDLGVATPDSE